MMTWQEIAMATTLFAPPLAALVLGLSMLRGKLLEEKFVRRLSGFVIAMTCVSACALCGFALWQRGDPIHFDFYGMKFLLDGLNAGWLFASALILGLVARFSATYMHREPGYARFSFLFLIFATGLFTLEASANIDFFFAGWELLGLSSVMLIAFFWERDMPVRRALYAFVVYRVCDIGLLAGVVLLHHYAHASDWEHAFGAGQWPLWTAHLEGHQATLLGLLFLLAAIGKSAQFPVTGWLPRAMEGPTPSSALFYGALSVHTGAFLLLRMSPLLEESEVARMCVFAVGALTAVTATMSGRTHNDAKNALAYATVAQVGLVFVEISLQCYKLALLHMLANAMLRTFQFLRAGSGLSDHLARRAAIGDDAMPKPVPSGPFVYWLSLRRFFVEDMLESVVLRPVVGLARALDRAQSAVEASLYGRSK